MQIKNWLFEAMDKLGEAGVDSPRRDALVLLEDTLQKDRSWVLAHSDYELTENELKTINELIDRRVLREPLAYIRGRAWFYGRFFTVNETVLIPRPESETIIELVKEINPASVYDIGTGSGCLAITLAHEIPNTQITATDISTEAIELCRKNAYDHHVKIDLKKVYLLEGLLDNSAPDLIVANLPYVPDDLITSPEILHEPKLALFAGENGMDLYESLWAQLSTSHHKPRYVITESLESQHSQMDSLAARSSYSLIKTDQLIQQWEQTE